MAIDPRDLKFEFSDETPSHWSPGRPEFSHFANGFMALLPYLEPYFIHNIRGALAHVSDARLKADAEGFIKQEARHAQQHRAWNHVLATRYPGFEALENALKQKLVESKREDSLEKRLAYTAGFEAITYQVVCFIVTERERWLRDADPDVIAMLTWHAAEEVEHKNVAHDIFQAVSGRYWLRVWGVAAALVHTVRDLRAFARLMLEADGLWDDPESQRRLWGVRLALAKSVLPPLARYVLPRYTPPALDPALIMAWLANYDAGRDLRRLSFEALNALDLPANPANDAPQRRSA